ncbi:MAG TPA: lipoyl(octanoyl) transferase LipB [Thermoanaerobaculia bacterium]|nr:lipoyl(octanoyl) transferase LipB [Thermoanaerobaculia bacterium]HQN07843.1 lipoyl(octanoyl) transferase LipB [Thermoanaerobaculia bacterium]HQP86643.1 lipoyl(octanoyl) transferase LipB [Thermoanaerobaculia bacterium]
MRRPVDVVSLLPLGPRPYDDVVALQKEAEARAKEGGRETLFLLEHEDVITAGRNAGTDDLHLPAEQLARLGVAFRRSDRGGKLTFHGPGQLVAYPILRLEGPERDVRRFVRSLEEVLILTAAAFGVTAARSDLPARWSSVWVGNDKLAAIGVHLSDWVTTHGVALNVTTRLDRFELFVPCGIRDGGVTSLERARPDLPPPPLVDVAARFVESFAEVFERDAVPVSAASSSEELAPPTAAASRSTGPDRSPSNGA